VEFLLRFDRQKVLNDIGDYRKISYNFFFLKVGSLLSRVKRELKYGSNRGGVKIDSLGYLVRRSLFLQTRCELG